ncbi:MAG: (d)CMP kinase [Desulfobacterales bacterium]|nr:(d)CMP kinase [Desulfobacterales bacterium]
MKDLLITIDGPAGSGKTTVSRNLADRLGYAYVDTGSLYRGVAYEAKKQGIAADDDAALERLCAGIELRMVNTAAGTRLFSGDEDITDKLRTPEMSMMASAVSARPVVRQALLGIQRQLGAQKRAVFEGRDMGTVVFPDADFKFFLMADLNTRAMRRYKEILEKSAQSFEAVAADMKKRDENDAARDAAPLKPAADAVVIDSTDLSVDAVVGEMIRRVAGQTHP